MRLKGSSKADRLIAGAGDDSVSGGRGNDWIEGCGGDDTLTGGADRDILTGGDGEDSFLFDEGETDASRQAADVITDFNQADGDRVNLKAIDARLLASGDQMFTFIGDDAFDGAVGRLRYEAIGGFTYIEGDVDGDRTADFVIRLNGEFDLIAQDFVL